MKKNIGNRPSDSFTRLENIGNWEIFARDSYRRWMQLKAVSKYPRRGKANYWLAWSLDQKRFASSLEYQYLREREPKLHAELFGAMLRFEHSANSLAGRYFHRLDSEGGLDQQGQILSDSGDKVEVVLFSWITGEESATTSYLPSDLSDPNQFRVYKTWLEFRRAGNSVSTKCRASKDQLLLGRRYNRTKKTHGGERKASDQNEHLKTAERLAAEHFVGQATVRRAAKFAEEVERTA